MHKNITTYKNAEAAYNFLHKKNAAIPTQILFLSLLSHNYSFHVVKVVKKGFQGKIWYSEITQILAFYEHL